MAKRKRLSLANPLVLDDETSSSTTQPFMTRAPIAEVASETSAVAAMTQLSQEMAAAREEGRMVIDLRLDQIRLDYLMRDRLVTDEPEMEALMASIRESGQKTPIDVALIAPGEYGLISGWRRCEALRRLHVAGERPDTVKALLRRPESMTDSYLSMVEENEIRVGLSYYERARIIAKVVEHSVFETHKAALLTLFRSASRAKRSKIRSFLTLVESLDAVLKFPHAIGERLGLQLAKQMEADPAFTARITAQLHKTPAPDSEAELSSLNAMLGMVSVKPKRPSTKPDVTQHDVRPGLKVRLFGVDGRMELSGPAITQDLRMRLLDWLKSQS
jgi:ParB family transcriptional regulator, chromosome partitioning protein